MPESPRRVALLIGNGRFDDPKLSALTAPLADVKALREVLLDSSIGGFDEVVVLIDANFADAYAAIGELFRVELSDDTIVLYYSGHGLPDERGHLYLATRNTSAANPDGNSIPAAEIKRMMSSSRSRRQVLVLDCCYSGAFGAAKDRTPLAISSDTFSTQGFGQHVLTASRSVERAYEGNSEIDGVETSLFTHFLIRGLETGEAARAGEDQVTVGDLYNYVYHRVISHSNKMRPQMWVDEGQGELVIARNPMPQQVPDELNEMLKSDNWYLREGAVRIIGQWLHTSDPEKRDLAARILNDQNNREHHRFVAKAIEEELQRANVTNDSTATDEAFVTDEALATYEVFATDEEAEKVTEDHTVGKLLLSWKIDAFAFASVILALITAFFLWYWTMVGEWRARYEKQVTLLETLTVELDTAQTDLETVKRERDEARELLFKANKQIERLRMLLSSGDFILR